MCTPPTFATEAQQSCNRAATELQQSCNRAATELYLEFERWCALHLLEPLSSECQVVALHGGVGGDGGGRRGWVGGGGGGVGGGAEELESLVLVCGGTHM